MYVCHILPPPKARLRGLKCQIKLYPMRFDKRLKNCVNESCKNIFLKECLKLEMPDHEIPLFSLLYDHVQNEIKLHLSCMYILQKEHVFIE